jgi:hypothetical protein
MAYILALTPGELADNRTKFEIELRLTKAYPKRVQRVGGAPGPRIALVLRDRDRDDGVRRLEWLGVASRVNTVGAVDNSITVDPLRPCLESIPLDGPSGLPGEFREELREEFSRSISVQSVGTCGQAAWEEFERVLREKHPGMTGLLDWLLAQASQQRFDDRDPADRSWQEQRDCAACLVRISGFPPLTLAAWRRPREGDVPTWLD